MTSPTSSPGRTIGGRYTLSAPIGSGGMGTVWRAHDEVLRRDVAVKEVVLPRGMPDDERAMLCERTLREARAAASLTHPSVVRVYDVVEEDGRPWIVMELLAARSIADLIRDDGPLSPARAADVGLQVLGALDTAHQAGILHRDVKPGNILLSEDGRATLSDFGVARTTGDAPLTSTGLLIGSPHYISPERARGGKPGPPSDLWGLGATLYAAVEGRPPFDRGDPLPTLTAVVSDPPEPYTNAGPLGPVLDGLLHKDPAERWDAQRARTGFQDVLAHRQPVPDAAPAATAVMSTPAAAVRRPSSSDVITPDPVRVPVDTGNDPERTAVLPAAPVSSGPGPSPDRYGDTAAYPRPPTGAAAAATWSSAPETHAAPADRPPREPSRRRALVVLGGLVVLALIGITLAMLTGHGGGTNNDAASTKPSASAPAANTRTYSDPNGFTVAVPRGWTQADKPGNVIDFREPSGSRFLRFNVATTNTTDPKVLFAAGERAFTSQQRIQGYKRLSIDSATVAGHPGAVWEFTYVDADSGDQRHVRYETFIQAGKSYQLYLSTPERQFTGSLPMLATAEKSFKTTG